MKFPRIGPAFLVTAAFIGPGTVITSSLAGANYGYSLIWALVFSIIATIILQEMAARLGIVTQKGLGENIRECCQNPTIRTLAVLLVVSAIVIGNGAYQSGNISGASLGLASIVNTSFLNVFEVPPIIFPLIIGAVAFILLYTSSYKIIERSLIFLVAVMSLAFILTFLMTKPDWSLFVLGAFTLSFPTGSMFTIIALIGTTVVPYNLFLHSALVKEKWKTKSIYLICQT